MSEYLKNPAGQIVSRPRIITDSGVAVQSPTLSHLIALGWSEPTKSEIDAALSAEAAAAAAAKAAAEAEAKAEEDKKAEKARLKKAVKDAKNDKEKLAALVALVDAL